MRLTIIGCAGSFPGPESAASCYLVEAPHQGRTFRLVVDLGNGAVGPLQRHTELDAIDAVALSHLHADHCLDMCGLYVARKYHPSGERRRIPVYAPVDAPGRLARAYDLPAEPGMNGQFDFHAWADGVPVRIGPFTVRASRVDHPVEAFALRIECDGRVLAYSGDTGPTPALVDVARDAHLFLCEASFVESSQNPPGLHLTGAEAGRAAREAGAERLLVTHVPAWIDRAEVERDARVTFRGPLELVHAGAVYEV